MARSLVWVVLGLGLAALAAFALLGGESDAPERADWALGDAAPGKAEEHAGPGLLGSGREGARTAKAGRGGGDFAIRGRVVDDKGRPIPGVPVEALDAGRPWIPNATGSWGDRTEDVVRRALAALDDPDGAQPPLAARATGDGEARFHLSVARAARYEVHARPSPPLVGTYESVSVHAEQAEAETTLRVLPGTALRGRVLDEADRPVAARLKAIWWKSEMNSNRRWSSPLLTTDAATGAFSLAAVPAGTVRFAVYLPGGRKVTGLKVETPAQDEVILRVPEGESAVTGVVSDADGHAIEGARVLLAVGAPREDGSTTSAKAVTDAQGGYRIASVPPGAVQSAQVLAAGFLPLRQYVRDAPWSGARTAKGETLTLDLTLQRGGRVHGRVLVQGGNTPIANARVRLVPARQGPSSASGNGQSTRTDASGRYAFEGVATGRYAALPDHPAHYLPALARENQGALRASRGPVTPVELTVVITQDGAAVERDLELAPGSGARGVVLDPEGKPAPDAEIRARGFGLSQVAWAWGLGGVSSEPLATSGEDGRFETRALPPRPDWVLYAKKDGFVGKFSAAFALTPDSPPPSIELRLQVGATVRGRVVGVEAESLEGAQVGLWGQGGELASTRTMKPLEADGTFEFTGLPAGTWTLNVWSGGRQGTQEVLADLKPGEVREGIELRLTAGVEVAGVLVDPHGRGVPDVNLMLQSRGGGSTTHTRTGEDGSFRFPGATAGPAQLLVWENNTSSALGPSFEAPATGLRVVYEREPVVTITGTVLDEAGAPVPLSLVKITAFAKGGRNPGPTYFGLENGVECVGGTFRRQVTGNPPYRVSVTQPRDADGRALNLRPGKRTIADATQPVVVRLEGGLEIAGRVLDHQGRPLADVAVTAREESVRTDAQGRFCVSGLAPGSVPVGVTPPRGFVRPAWRQVPAGSADLEYRLQPGLEIRGKALGPEGKPLTQGHASASWKETAQGPAGSSGAQLDPGGTFVLPGIPAGARVTVKVQQWSSTRAVAYAPAVVEGVRPGTDDLVLRLGEGVTIQGVVLDADGRPATGCFVYAAAVDEPGNRTGWLQPKSDGTFTLSGLKPGRYQVGVQLQGGGVAPDPVEADAPSSGVTLQLPRSVALAGRLVGLQGDEDATRWRVRAWTKDGRKGGDARVGPDGTWRIAAVRESESYTVGAMDWKDTRYALEEDVKPGALDVGLRLRAGQRITGTLDRAGLNPAMGGSVVARGTIWQSPGSVDPQTGRFEISGLPPGRYALTARLNDGSGAGTLEKVEAGSANVTIPVRAR